MSQRVLLNGIEKQKLNYSGKNKRPTQKTQIIADKSSRKILCTAFGREQKCDFKLFRNSKIYLKEEAVCLTYTGYQGMLKLHRNSELPKKKSKKRPLTKEDKNITGVLLL